MTEPVDVTAEFEPLNWTNSRHLLLAFAATGTGAIGAIDRHEYLGIDPLWVQHSTNVAYQGNDVRSLNALMSHGLIAYNRLDDGRSHKSVIVVTELGRQALAEWDAYHPDVLPELDGPWTVEGNIMSDAPGSEVGKTLGVMIANDYVNLRITTDSEYVNLERCADALVARLNGNAQGVLL